MPISCAEKALSPFRIHDTSGTDGLTNPWEINLEIGEPLPYEVVLKGGQIRFPKGHKVTADILKMLREGIVEQVQIDWSAEDVEYGLFPQKRRDSQTEQHLKNFYVMKKARARINSISGDFDDPMSPVKECLLALWNNPSAEIDINLITRKIDECISRAPENVKLLSTIGWNSEPGNYFPSHMVETSRFVSWLGLMMGFSRDEVRTMSLAAIMHDIGELFTGRDMLVKAGGLEPSEMKRLREHPRKSVEWLKRADVDFENLHKLVLRHHERHDGTGYPYNLNGKILEKSDSILALADVYVALVNPRPYRAPMTRRQALRMLLERRGKWFPIELVENFASMIGIYPPGSLVELSSGRITLILEPPSKEGWRALMIDLESGSDEFREVDLKGIEGDYITREIA